MAAHVVQSWRQTTPIPAKSGVPSHGRTSSGGPPPLGKRVAAFVRMLRDKQYGGSVTRTLGTAFDRLIMRDRHPTYYRGTYIPPGDNWVSWTAAGPARPALHMRQATYRPWAGSSSSRFPYIPTSPTGGLHTDTGHSKPRTERRYAATPQQQAARINRLSPSRYHGQTYSQQTAVQGGNPR